MLCFVDLLLFFCCCSGLSVSGFTKLNWVAWLMKKLLWLPWAVGTPESRRVAFIILESQNWWHFSVSSDFSITCQSVTSNTSLRSGYTLLVFMMFPIFLFIYFSAQRWTMKKKKKEPYIKFVKIGGKESRVLTLPLQGPAGWIFSCVGLLSSFQMALYQFRRGDRVVNGEQCQELVLYMYFCEWDIQYLTN